MGNTTDCGAPQLRNAQFADKRCPTTAGSIGVGCKERCLRGSNASSPSSGANTRPRMRLKGVRMDQQRENQSPSAKIATSVVQVMQAYTGRGPTKAKTTINEDLVTVVLADTLTNGERSLVESGRA